MPNQKLPEDRKEAEAAWNQLVEAYSDVLDSLTPKELEQFTGLSDKRCKQLVKLFWEVCDV